MKRTIRIAALFAALMSLASCTTKPVVVVTTEQSQWQEISGMKAGEDAAQESLVVDLEAKGQVMQGFGTAFSELSHDALAALADADRDAILAELFLPGNGASFTICRTPMGASDFARDYYSYNSVDGDLDMLNFTIDRDRNGLLPLIKWAQAKNPDLKIWASPWCPPSWLKTNKLYASVPTSPMRVAYNSGVRSVEDIPAGVITDNGVTFETMRLEGTDSFIMEEQYLKAYALYFQKYIKAYREQGVDIFMVMPQNEPNSAQVFPSCTWTPQGLASFERYLGPAMEEMGVLMYHGTIERPDWHQVETCLEDPEAGKYIKGVAFQWAGKDALPEIHKRYPDLTMVMSEHQCFNGDNSWKDLMDSWDLVKHYISNGVCIYDYWNLALTKDGVSSWGWKQNSLVLVDKENRTYKYNYEYYLMKHLSHYVLPGSVYLGTTGSYPEALAFRRPDGKIVIVAAEKEGVQRALDITVGSKTASAVLEPNSIATIVL